MKNEFLKQRLKQKALENEVNKVIEGFNSSYFLSIEETNELSNKIYIKIDKTLFQKEIIKDIDFNIKTLLLIKRQFINIWNQEGILFHFYDRESGAIKISFNNLFNNLEFFIKFIKFDIGYRDFLFVDKELKFGVCIEKFEYFNKLIIWNEL